MVEVTTMERQIKTMFEQDYIMRLIKEMVRALIKLIFHIDTESPMEELIENEEEKETIGELLHMVDLGNINEAENKLYTMLKGSNQQSLKIALLFYSYLNDLSDETLLQSNFSREEVKDGLKEAVSMYGLEGMVDAFL